MESDQRTDKPATCAVTGINDSVKNTFDVLVKGLVNTDCDANRYARNTTHTAKHFVRCRTYIPHFCADDRIRTEDIIFRY
jgi:hypothetical protein